MSNKNRDGFVVLFAIALLISPLIYVALQGSDDIAYEDSDRNDQYSIGEHHSLYSDVLDEDREYLVYLPRSYDDDTFTEQDYPVMYLLDGDAHFHSASGVVQFLSEGINGTRRIPEMIIVAIPNTDRTRDLTPTHTMTGYNGDEQEFLTSSGGGEKFLQFLHEELFAEIESDYRTLPHRTLVGHSFGGLAALHALVHAPGMFRNHIAIDPSLWWHNQLLVSQAADAFVEDHNYAGAVYISLANNPPLGDADPKIMENAGREFASILAGVNNESFSSAMGFYENDDHGSVPLISLYDGLLTIFDGYEIDPERLVEDPLYINEHFERVSAMMGVDFPPPEAAINDFGYFFLYGVEDYEAAITTMQLNVEHYPDSYNVYDSLAEVYAANGDTELAIANYEKSLELNPDNENAQEQIEALLDNSREETEAQE